MKGPCGFLVNLSGINVTVRAGKMAAQSRSPGNKQQKGVRFFRSGQGIRFFGIIIGCIDIRV